MVLAAAVVAAGTVTARNVVIKGRVDAGELHRLALQSKDDPIYVLDLSEAEITAWKGKRGAANATYHPPMTLPAYGLSGLRASEVIMPAGLTAIGDGALMGAEITSVTIPASVTDMGRWVLAGCKKLTRATIETDRVPERTFEGCVSLAQITLPASLTEIGAEAFRGCESLKYVSMPAALRSVGRGAFSRSGLTEVYFSNCDRLTEMADEVFAHCNSLKVAIMPDGLKRMGYGVFMADSELTAVYLPAQLTEVPMLTLSGAKSVSEGRLIPDGVTRIGDFAYSSVSTPATLTLPASLAYIGTEAFSHWTSLKSVDASMLTEVPQLGEDVWAGIDQSKVDLTVWEQIASLYMAAPQWCDFNILTSGIDRVEAPEGNRLRVRFEGADLLVEADRLIVSAMVVDLSGRTVAEGGGSASLRLDTSAAQSPFMILSAKLEGDIESSVKLMR